MAIVTINDSNLTAIADAIRTKNGTETTYKPSEMAAAIANLPAGQITDYLTDTTNYGCIWYQPTSETTAAREINLPDDVAFEDIKFIIGMGGRNNSSVTCYNSADFGTFIYCPDLYSKEIQDDLGNVYWACFGGMSIRYSSNEFQGIDYGRGYQCATRGATQILNFYWISYNSTDHTLTLHTTGTHSSTTPTDIDQGYILCKYGRLAIIYDQRGAA